MQNNFLNYKNNNNIYIGSLVFLLSISLAYKFTLPENLLGDNIFFIEDDLFYYFKIAKNFWIYHTFTFDGLVSTNGFHPLWQYMLIIIFGIAKLFGIENHFFYIALISNMFLYILSAILFYKILNIKLAKLKSFVLAYFVYLFSLTFLVNGMESILVILLFQVYILFFIYIAPKQQKYSLAVNVTLLILITFARLDAVVVSVGLLFINYIYFDKKYVIKIFLIYFLILICFLWFNYLFFSSFLPISGQVKQFWADLQPINLSYMYIKALKLMHTPLEPFIKSKKVFEIMDYLIVFFSILSLCKFLFIGKKDILRNTIDRQFVIFFLIACLYILSQIVYNYLFSSMLWKWYLSFMVIVAAFVLMGAMLYLFALSDKLLMVFILLVCILDLYNTHLARKAIVQNYSWAKATNEVISWIDKNTKKDDVVGMWAAGKIGYYSDRKVVNLEGLVGDIDLLLHNKNNSLIDYVDKHNINYILQWFPSHSFEHPYVFDKKKLVFKPTLGPIIDIRARLLYANKCSFDMLKTIPLEDSIKKYSIYIFKRNKNKERKCKQSIVPIFNILL